MEKDNKNGHAQTQEYSTHCLLQCLCLQSLCWILVLKGSYSTSEHTDFLPEAVLALGYHSFIKYLHVMVTCSVQRTQSLIGSVGECMVRFPFADLTDQADISKHTSCVIYQWLRKLSCGMESPIVLCMPGIVVQVDQSQHSAIVR